MQIITSDIRKLIDAFHSADFKGEGWLEKESVGDLLDGLGVRLTDQVEFSCRFYFVIIFWVQFSASKTCSTNLIPTETEISI